MSRGIRPYGEHAILLTVDDPVELAGIVRALVAAPPTGVVDVVPGAETILLTAGPDVDLRALAQHARTVEPRSAGAAAVGAVDLDVRYDGPDLAEVATLTGLSRAEVVDAHTTTPWQVAFGGFAPGFAYLVGGDPRLRVPRRPSPRTVVPAGSVGLADAYSGVYPIASPGGWQLIGVSDAVLFDVDRDPPALLTPGTVVRFRAVQ